MSKPFDLEERTLIFAKAVIDLSKNLKSGLAQNEFISQVVRSAGSVGANYREANEALGKKDFVHRLRISRKECKESTQESKELRNILSAIIEKVN